MLPGQQFDVYEYLGYLRRRWIFWVAACAAAMAAAIVFSLITPKEYTSTASILIDVPGAADPRASTAVTQIYLESLRTYEHFAQSDSLFVEALDKFHLRDENPKASVDGLKRRVLKVTKPRDTKILQVSATLRDPTKAQELAQYIATRTVELNRALVRQSDQDMVDEVQRQLDAANGKTQQAEKTLERETAREPYEALQGEVDNLVELQGRLRRDLLQAKVDIADYTAQGNQRELAAVRARADALEKQVAEIAREVPAKEKTAAERRAKLDALAADVKASRAAAQIVENRLNEIRQLSGNRSERLRIIDPGIVPQQPSSPGRTLIVLIAVLIAAMLSWLYLTVAFNFRRQSLRHDISAYRSER